MRALRFLVWKEFLQIVRDKATLAQMLMVPIVQLLVLSNAATFSIQETSVAVVDQDRTTSSVALADRLTGGRQFSVERVTASPNEAERDLVEGRASMILHIPPRFEEELVRDRRAQVQLSLNAEEGAVAGLVGGYAQAIIADFARDRSATIRAGGMEVRPRAWFNATRNYKHYMVPAILVSLITIIGTLVTAQNVARERELGTLEQLNVTPLTKTQFIAGKLIPAWIAGLVIFAVGLAVGKLLFGIPIRGPVWVVMVGAGIYLTVALGIGLFVSTITRTQQQTMFVSFFLLMIYLLMSGMFTPIESMPSWAQMVGAATPVRHFVWVMRAVLVRGAGFETVWPMLAGLGVAGLAVLALAVRLYNKTSG
ncbi:MAG: putative multidrug ABC transporter permease YbhR [Gemmatimonadaceae bacterium]|nr:putative multidrug ABC transporter permease YbhR [Gemmatimonadaceae bacterium]